ncbi:MAG: hypothetical protein R2697_00455 [Ilumatobacteraceae bacterium]
MEYVQGRSLAEILKTNQQLTPKQAAEIASEVAAALGFAHEAGLAHRATHHHQAGQHHGGRQRAVVKSPTSASPGP